MKILTTLALMLLVSCESSEKPKISHDYDMYLLKNRRVYSFKTQEGIHCFVTTSDNIFCLHINEDDKDE